MIKRKPQRKYNKVSDYFHNFEHSPSGSNHCHSAGKHPYTISHLGGKHVISGNQATGHGRGNKPQTFKFTKRLGSGYDLASGVKT